MRLTTFTEPQVDFWFRNLDITLRTTGLPTSQGSYRLGVSADEFMLMHVDRFMAGYGAGYHFKAAFKHRDTRNYLTLESTPGGWKIVIPVGGAFCLGQFDDLSRAA